MSYATGNPMSNISMHRWLIGMSTEMEKLCSLPTSHLSKEAWRTTQQYVCVGKETAGECPTGITVVDKTMRTAEPWVQRMSNAGLHIFQDVASPRFSYRILTALIPPIHVCVDVQIRLRDPVHCQY
jgi:hypothetical protein